MPWILRFINKSEETLTKEERKILAKNLPEPVVGHVHHFSCGVEPPLKVDVRLRVGDDLTRDAGRLLTGYPKHLNLVRFAVRCI